MTTWNPGTHRENPWFIGWGKHPDRELADPLLVYHADGVGELTLLPISVHRPGDYPTRVFFRREWRTPEGKVFGSNRLYIATLGEFRRIAKGYRFDFEAQGCVYWTEADQGVPMTFFSHVRPNKNATSFVEQ
jgi:hypothetical protein